MCHMSIKTLPPQAELCGVSGVSEISITPNHHPSSMWRSQWAFHQRLKDNNNMAWHVCLFRFDGNYISHGEGWWDLHSHDASQLKGSNPTNTAQGRLNEADSFFEERTWEMRAAVSTLLTVLMHSQPTWGCLCFISEEAHVQTHVGA